MPSAMTAESAWSMIYSIILFYLVAFEGEKYDLKEEHLVVSIDSWLLSKIAFANKYKRIQRAYFKQNFYCNCNLEHNCEE